MRIGPGWQLSGSASLLHTRYLDADRPVQRPSIWTGARSPLRPVQALGGLGVR